MPLYTKIKINTTNFYKFNYCKINDDPIAIPLTDEDGYEYCIFIINYKPVINITFFNSYDYNYRYYCEYPITINLNQYRPKINIDLNKNDNIYTTY